MYQDTERNAWMDCGIADYTAYGTAKIDQYGRVLFRPFGPGYVWRVAPKADVWVIETRSDGATARIPYTEYLRKIDALP